MLCNVAKSIPLEEKPDGPIVPCLGCGAGFVWWLHPIPLCDDCVEKAYGEVALSESEQPTPVG